ncbi:MAG TPA: mercuric transporter MerT family protein [Candidatus Xenobia bacterium]|nr:mercuric transporter MerT family protein [Candidatus Xenobia bacterium]
MLPAAAALVTASCCLALGLGLLGLSSATLTFLIPWRPYFLALTVILLGWAFYQAYRPLPAPQACEPGGTCTHPMGRRWQRIFLWIIGVVSLGLATVPYWLSWVLYWLAVWED